MSGCLGVIAIAQKILKQMIETIKEIKPKARKSHDCMACDFLLEEHRGGQFTFSELRLIARAKRNSWQIQKGEIYIRQTNVFDGDVYDFKAIPAIHQICVKHGLYPEV